jgi:deazaflavin-dependent oxidoreductase (nitroreductase family)
VRNSASLKTLENHMSQTAPLKQPTSRRFMTWMLRSPFHVFMGGLLLITVTGRKSGRAISTPVNYVRDGDTLLITSKVDRTWWKNLRGGAPVTLLMNGKTYQAHATAIEDRTAVEGELLRFFRLIKRTIAGIHLDKDGRPTKPEKFAQVALTRVVIEITQLARQ